MQPVANAVDDVGEAPHQDADDDEHDTDAGQRDPEARCRPVRSPRTEPLPQRRSWRRRLRGRGRDTALLGTA